MDTITDEYMKEMLAKSKFYSLLILKAGPKEIAPDQIKIVWEHGRRNFELQAKGLLSIVCPVREESNIKGIGIFNVDKEELKKIMDEDTGVKEGIFTYEIFYAKVFRVICCHRKHHLSTFLAFFISPILSDNVRVKL